VLGMAVAVIIGGAFGKIVSSLVNDIIMPPIGLVLGNVDFSNLFINLSAKPFASLEEAKTAGTVTINNGLLLNNVVDFLIIAFVIFLLVRAANSLQKKGPEAEGKPSTKECPFCCSSIAIKTTRCPSCTSGFIVLLNQYILSSVSLGQAIRGKEKSSRHIFST
jgi:large conductance mechanosensitive channel